MHAPFLNFSDRQSMMICLFFCCFHYIITMFFLQYGGHFLFHIPMMFLSTHHASRSTTAVISAADEPESSLNFPVRIYRRHEKPSTHKTNPSIGKSIIFSLTAPAISKFRRHSIECVIPQPGQRSPVICRKTQGMPKPSQETTAAYSNPQTRKRAAARATLRILVLISELIPQQERAC